MGQSNRTDGRTIERANIPVWLMHNHGKFIARGRHYDVCIDPSHKAWAVVYVLINCKRTPVPVFGPVDLETKTNCEVSRKLQEKLYAWYTPRG